MLKRIIKRLILKNALHSQPTILHYGELLKGQTVLITGAGGRLGRDMIRAFQHQQAQVIFTELSDEIVANVEADCPGALGLVADGHDPQPILSFLDLHNFTPHILVNNTGISVEKSFWDETKPDWDLVFRTNVIDPVFLTKAIAKRMITADVSGSIVFISSVHRTIPSRWPAYSASKAALEMVIKELAIDLAPHKIRVNCVAPGWSQPESKSFALALLENRSIDPMYIGHAVVFLSTNSLSRFTTGSVLTVDAGFSLFSGRALQQGSGG